MWQWLLVPLLLIPEVPFACQVVVLLKDLYLRGFHGKVPCYLFLCLFLEELLWIGFVNSYTLSLAWACKAQVKAVLKMQAYEPLTCKEPPTLVILVNN